MNLDNIPCDMQAEKSLIGCLILQSDIIHDMTINDQDFFFIDYKKLFGSIKKLDDKADLSSLQIDSWVDLETILSCQNFLHNPWGRRYYHDIIQEKSNARKLLNASKLMEHLVNLGENSSTVVAKVSQAMELRETENNIDHFEQALNNYGHNTSRMCDMWFEWLDKRHDWIHSSRLYVIWARPHIWKTLFSCNLAKNIALQWVKVSYFTMEMQWYEIADRMIGATCLINYYDRKTKTRDEIKQLDDAIIQKLKDYTTIHSWWFFIEDIVARIRRDYKNWTKLFIVDHLWLIKTVWKDTKNNEIGSRTARLKQLSLELDICIFLLSQLNRWEKNTLPMMINLRDSGNIEQDADTVILLHRENSSDWELDHELMFLTHKNRVTWELWEDKATIHKWTFNLFTEPKQVVKPPQDREVRF